LQLKKWVKYNSVLEDNFSYDLLFKNKTTALTFMSHLL